VGLSRIKKKLVEMLEISLVAKSWWAFPEYWEK